MQKYKYFPIGTRLRSKDPRIKPIIAYITKHFEDHEYAYEIEYHWQGRKFIARITSRLTWLPEEEFAVWEIANEE